MQMEGTDLVQQRGEVARAEIGGMLGEIRVFCCPWFLFVLVFCLSSGFETITTSTTSTMITMITKSTQSPTSTTSIIGTTSATGITSTTGAKDRNY